MRSIVISIYTWKPLERDATTEKNATPKCNEWENSLVFLSSRSRLDLVGVAFHAKHELFFINTHTHLDALLRLRCKIVNESNASVTMHRHCSDVWSTLITLAFGDQQWIYIFFPWATVKQNPVLRSVFEAVRQSQSASRKADNELD